MNMLYDIIFIIFAIFYLPYFLIKGRYRHGFLTRLGFYNKSVKDALSAKKVIWLHAVSVGEVASSKELIKEIKARYPDYMLVVSTVTFTGNSLAKSMLDEKDCLIYLPLDISFIVKKALTLIRPRLFIIVETELWPNLIRQLCANKVPIILINGRISDKSFKRYSLIKPIVRTILRKVNLFCMQSQTYKTRAISLGADPARVYVTGNMKFDAANPASSANNAQTPAWLSDKDKLFIAGSTHKGEEEIIINAYRIARGEFKNLKLLIAPRHPERFDEVENLINKCGFKAIRMSKFTVYSLQFTVNDILLLDTIGQLGLIYQYADIVFVGGSLIKKGGHNIIEPANFAKPIIVGPYTFNFRDIVELLVAGGALRVIKNSHELGPVLRELLLNAQEMRDMGSAAKKIIDANIGASKRNFSEISRLLKAI